jgi:hypothetical protein
LRLNAKPADDKSGAMELWGFAWGVFGFWGIN